MLGPQYGDEAAATLREIIANPSTDASDRLKAARSLARLGPGYRDEAAATLREIIANPSTDASDRWQAAEVAG